MKSLLFVIVMCMGCSSFATVYTYSSNSSILTPVNVNITGDVKVHDVNKARENDLREKELALKKQQMEIQKKLDRSKYERNLQDRDAALEARASELGDQMCIDYFCGKRCNKNASRHGYCAKHYREKKDGTKKIKYRTESYRIFN